MGFVKGEMYPWAGYIGRNDDGSFDLSYDGGYTNVPCLESIGLCDVMCYYEWTHNKNPIPLSRMDLVLGDC